MLRAEICDLVAAGNCEKVVMYAYQGLGEMSVNLEDIDGVSSLMHGQIHDAVLHYSSG